MLDTVVMHDQQILSVAFALLAQSTTDNRIAPSPAYIQYLTGLNKKKASVVAEALADSGFIVAVEKHAVCPACYAPLVWEVLGELPLKGVLRREIEAKIKRCELASCPWGIWPAVVRSYRLLPRGELGIYWRIDAPPEHRNHYAATFLMDRSVRDNVASDLGTPKSMVGNVYSVQVETSYIWGEIRNVITSVQKSK